MQPVVAVNMPFGKAFGVAPKDLVGKNDYDIYPRESVVTRGCIGTNPTKRNCSKRYREITMKRTATPNFPIG